jgi:hypothetical protein
VIDPTEQQSALTCWLHPVRHHASGCSCGGTWTVLLHMHQLGTPHAAPAAPPPPTVAVVTERQSQHVVPSQPPAYCATLLCPAACYVRRWLRCATAPFLWCARLVAWPTQCLMWTMTRSGRRTWVSVVTAEATCVWGHGGTCGVGAWMVYLHPSGLAARNSQAAAVGAPVA